ncbi:YhgE/Pip domain-containing protein [Lysinibacillus sp. NPDC059133]|uniref:YhgE/Pip domain-containing protein n=1 Tax=Lysinibacillus sp. NPDC059133 TaxID=3346737 RepID=UPI00369349D8
MGETIVTNLKENAPDAVKFIEYDSASAMKDGMKERETYGGIVISKDFSNQIASLQSEAASPADLELYVNEGVNTNVATSMENVLKQITRQISSNVSAQMLASK